MDAIGLIGQLLDTMVCPTPPKPKEKRPRDWWDRDEPQRPGLNWKTV